LRDRLPVEDAAHLAAQLPLLIRGAFYEQYRPAVQPEPMRSREEFVARVANGLEGGGKSVSPEKAIKAVFSTVQRHVVEAETAKVRHALPEDIRMLWPPNARIPQVKRGDGSMKVAEVMSRNVQLANPNDTLGEVARRMTAMDIGFLPVGENDRLVGTITDRDIVARAVAEGRDGQACVRDAMTRDVKYCFEDDSIDDAIQEMSDVQVRRLPVVNRNKRLVGIVSLADAAMKYDPAATGAAMCGVVEPGGSHVSSA
jgi:CBS domain-containing protein